MKPSDTSSLKKHLTSSVHKMTDHDLLVQGKQQATLRDDPVDASLTFNKTNYLQALYRLFCT
jgi:hypothetical protein